MKDGEFQLLLKPYSLEALAEALGVEVTCKHHQSRGTGGELWRAPSRRGKKRVFDATRVARWTPACRAGGACANANSPRSRKSAGARVPRRVPCPLQNDGTSQPALPYGYP